MRGGLARCALLCMLLSLGVEGRAQEARGTIQGRVSDESGGVVPGARVDGDQRRDRRRDTDTRRTSKATTVCPS